MQFFLNQTCPKHDNLPFKKTEHHNSVHDWIFSLFSLHHPSLRVPRPSQPPLPPLRQLYRPETMGGRGRPPLYNNRVRVPPVLDLGFTYVETGEMLLGISSPRCSSYFWWRLVVVWLLMVLRWKEMEEGGDTASKSTSIKLDLGSPHRGDEIVLLLFSCYRGGHQEKERRHVAIFCRSMEQATMETTAIFRSTLWEVHHQGTEAGDFALPLYPMAEWRLSSRSLTSIQRLFLSARSRSSPSRRPQVVRPQRCREGRRIWFCVGKESTTSTFLSDLGGLLLEVAGGRRRRDAST